MTPEKRETAIKWLQEEVRSLRLAPIINGCGPENWQDQLEIMETCLEAVRDYHFPDTRKMMPLTLEQLREKVGQPVVIKYSYGGPYTFAIVDVRYVPHLGADKIRLVFADGYITVNERDYGTYFTTYAYHPANIDREAWGPCELCGGDKLDGVGVGDHFGLRVYLRGGDKKPPENERFQFCPKCGRPLTPKAWDELEKRLRG